MSGRSEKRPLGTGRSKDAEPRMKVVLLQTSFISPDFTILGVVVPRQVGCDGLKPLPAASSPRWPGLQGALFAAKVRCHDHVNIDGTLIETLEAMRASTCSSARIVTVGSSTRLSFSGRAPSTGAGVASPVRRPGRVGGFGVHRVGGNARGRRGVAGGSWDGSPTRSRQSALRRRRRPAGTACPSCPPGIWRVQSARVGCSRWVGLLGRPTRVGLGQRS